MYDPLRQGDALRHTCLVLTRECPARNVLAQILPIETSRGRPMKEGIRHEEA
jgi:hypothetical protein